MTKPKPCKNCSCGRADPSAATGQDINIEAPKSSCGRCYLGDAFRCPGCPFTGQPAYKPGENVEIDTFQNSAGTIAETEEAAKVNESGAVKLDL
jgi:hypothetical protein